MAIPVTIYTYPASQVGSAFNVLQAVERADRSCRHFPQLRDRGDQALLEEVDRDGVVLDDQESSVDLTTKGSANTPQSPNDDRFPLIDTWNWEARGNVDLQPSVGHLHRRRRIEPSRARPGSGRRSSPRRRRCFGRAPSRCAWDRIGDFSSPAVQILALKAAKTVSVGGGRQLELTLPIVQPVQQQRHHRGQLSNRDAVRSGHGYHVRTGRSHWRRIHLLARISGARSESRKTEGRAL